ncbi:MAG: UDP-glucose 4-epimerase GalE [Clostridia bacterium]|nr:UDP-glucose 4-epimerase GalE [Clostridia bacterium]
MNILVTGGAGYIGSHTCVELLGEGFEVVVLDNLCNSSEESLERVEKITGKKLKFYKGDILDTEFLDRVFTENKIDGVIHFAGLKAVGESVKLPLMYYQNNVEGTVKLCLAMQKHGVKNIVFSSSATVYGKNEPPLSEKLPTGDCSNPYGRTKYFIEEILKDIYVSDNEWNIVLLRYFNPIGAHESGLIGEDPNGIPNNLMPYISQVAIGKLPKLNIFGNDYDTPDGTCIRDYIHVVDLAKGHIKAIEKVFEGCGIKTYNLGTGKGYSVMDIVNAFEESTGLKLNYEFAPRRAGDLPSVYSDPSLAEKELDWTAKYSIADMCRDTWNWQSKNPKGYKK